MLSLFRRRALVALLAVAALCAVAVGAQAAKTKATGGTTTLTPSTQAASALSAAGVTLAPIAPATAAGGSITFPIKRGKFNATTLRGRLFHSGGLAISNGKATVRLRHLTIVSTKKGATLFATVRVPKRVAKKIRRARRHHHQRAVASGHHQRLVVVRVGSLTDPKKSDDGKSVTVTVKSSKALAIVVNRLAKKHIVSAGASIGTATVAPTAS